VPSSWTIVICAKNFTFGLPSSADDDGAGDIFTYHVPDWIQSGLPSSSSWRFAIDPLQNCAFPFVVAAKLSEGVNAARENAIAAATSMAVALMLVFRPIEGRRPYSYLGRL
jgi:hypothetical protein